MSHDRIFIPQVPLYEAAGSDAIAKFGDRRGRNLVVVPQSYLLDLDRVSRSGGPTALAAKDALFYIHEVSKESGRYADSSFTEPTSIGDTLDLTFSNHELRRSEDLEELVEQVSDRYGAQPTVITPEPAHATVLRLQGIPVERPDFLIVEADIVKRSMIEGSEELHAALYDGSSRSVDIDHARELLGLTGDEQADMLFANQFIAFEGNDEDTMHYAKVQPNIQRTDNGYIFERGRSVRLLDTKKDPLSVLGVMPRDGEQQLALEHILLADDVQLGFVTGSQGSGKTLLTYAAAVDSILRYNGKRWKNDPRFEGKTAREFLPRYSQIVLFKSNDVMGGSHRDLGLLPGSQWEKQRPFMQSYIDAHKETPDLATFGFEQMLMHPMYANEFGLRDANAKTRDKALLPEDRPAIESGNSAFARGRTFVDSIIIIDEAQNFTPYEVKTLIERAGRGSKVIVTGDPLQVDNPRCSVEINGLTGAMRHFLDKPYVAALNLSSNYRSQASSDSRSWKVF